MTQELVFTVPMALSVAAWVATGMIAIIAVLAGVVTWFLRREIRNNDAAHADLRTDVKKLLEGDVAWVKDLQSQVRSLANRTP